MEKKEKQFIPREYLLTPREHHLIGGTTEEGDWPENVPFGITRGMPIAKIAEERRRLANYPDSFIGHALGYGRPIVIQFPEIETKTGHVSGEPKFIGFWDSQAERVMPAANQERFDAEVKAKLAKFRKKS